MDHGPDSNSIELVGNNGSEVLPEINSLPLAN
jgi:hypothetical protein